VVPCPAQVLETFSDSAEGEECVVVSAIAEPGKKID